MGFMAELAVIVLIITMVWCFAFKLGRKHGKQEIIDIKIRYIESREANIILDGIKNRHDSDLFTSGREN